MSSSEKSLGCVLLAVGVALCIPLTIWGGVRTYDSIVFDREIGGHLKRAADANSIEMAKEELETAVKTMEKWGMTNGYTSILYTTPNEDVGFWYKNIKSCLTQMTDLSHSATQGEKDLVLLKLRQTLLDHKAGHETVTMPEGISIFPHNTIMCVWCSVGGILFCIGALMVMVACKDYLNL